jgi:hypothetical protein
VIHAQLTETLPMLDRLLIGPRAILTELARLGIRRLNGQPITWRMVRAWRHSEGFPLLPGHRVLGRARTPSITTCHALTAWLLSRFTTAHVFRVAVAQHSPPCEASPHAQADAA